MIPVALTVIISSADTTTVDARAAKGPIIKPPMTIITSLGSYFKNGVAGMNANTGTICDRSITTNAIAEIIARTVRFFTFLLIELPPKLKTPEPKFGRNNSAENTALKSSSLIQTILSVPEFHRFCSSSRTLPPVGNRNHFLTTPRRPIFTFHCHHLVYHFGAHLQLKFLTKNRY